MAFCCKVAISQGKMAICPRTIAISRGKVTISQGKMAISPRTIAISWGKVTISLCKVAISQGKMAISLLIMVTLPYKMAIVCGILYVLDF